MAARKSVLGATVAPPDATVARRGGLGEDLPAEHHVVVLVGEVVAVRDVRAREGPEAARDDDILVGVEGDHVLLAGVIGTAAVGRQGAVARHDPVLLHVEVHGVYPAAATVADPPRPSRVLL